MSKGATRAREARSAVRPAPRPAEGDDDADEAPPARGASAARQEGSDSTVFVRNLSYETTDEELQRAFEQMGPVRRSFVVAKQGRSQGFGFVQFALPEDAARVVEQEQGMELGGRKLKLELAVQSGARPKVERAKPKSQSAAQSAAPQAESAATARRVPDKASSVVLVTNLAPEITADKLEKVCRRFGKVSAVLLPSPETLSAESQCARVEFDSVKAGAKAARLLPVKEISGRKLEVVPLNLKACRLIVRNLPFACDEAKLAKHFSASGRVAEASMPRSEDGKKKGFGFVQMETMAEAIAALRSLNESKLLGRTVAVDWALSKGQYHSIVAKVQESAAASAAAGGKPEKAVTVKQEVKDEDADEDDEDEAEADEDDDDEEEEKTGRSDAANRAEDEESDGDADSDTDAAREQSNGSRAKGKGAKMEDEGDDADVSDEEKDKHVSKLTAAQVEAEIDNAEELRQRNEREIERGGTIFIRNVAYETTEDGLKQRFSEFGTVRMAKIVMDKVLERPRGTAFVQFAEKASAEKAIAAAASAMPAVRAKEKLMITVGGAEGGVMLDGRSLLISPAISKEKAKEIDKNSLQRMKEDKRNLYLAREGLITEGMPAAEGVSAKDLERRAKAWQEKKTKLRNPNYIVSKTRLSVRNLPLQCLEKELRALVVRAVKEKKPSARVHIKQVKVVRDATRTDATGALRSKRYAFVEFEEHEDALLALRALNNNPAIFGPNARPIVEFALDDQRKLLVRRRRLEAQARSREAAAKTAGDGQGAPVAGDHREAAPSQRGRGRSSTRPQQRDASEGSLGRQRASSKGPQAPGGPAARNLHQRGRQQRPQGQPPQQNQRQQPQKVGQKPASPLGKRGARDPSPARSETNAKRAKPAPAAAKEDVASLAKQYANLFGAELVQKAKTSRWFEQ